MQVPEGYIAFAEELPGANSQGDTFEEARENLREAVALVLEANRELAEKSLAAFGSLPTIGDLWPLDRGTKRSGMWKTSG